MMEITVLDNQTMLDVALAYYGDVNAVLYLAADNGLAVGEALAPGQKLKIDPAKVVDSHVLKYYEQKAIKPATKYGNE